VHNNVARICGVLILCLAACGDSSSDPSDAGSDAGMDKPKPTARGRDAAPPLDDPTPECDRFEPNSCAAGQRCAVALRTLPDQSAFTILSVCIEDDGGRGLGDPCDPFGGFGLPYDAPGLTDEIYVDPCGEGLYCSDDPDVRGGLTSCQPACATGLYDPIPGGDCSELQFCAGPGPLEEVCTDSDQCNPSDSNSCGADNGCYLWRESSNLFSICVSNPDSDNMPGEGEACLDASGTRFINACGPGLQCWGPARLAPSEWTARDLLCRRSCSVDAPVLMDDDAGVVPTDAATADDDAGADPAPAMDGGTDAGSDAGSDASVPTGGSCRAGERCVALSESMLGVAALPEGSGLCE